MPQPSASAPAGSPSTSGGGSGRVLLAYSSRAGEDYFRGGRRNLEVGNTEVVATMIAELIDCDTNRIEASDPHPDGYDATVQRNVAEQDADARPASPTRWPRSRATSTCCWAARSGTCGRR